MTLQQLKEEASKELKEKFCVECPDGIRKGEIVLKPIYPKPIKDFIVSLITKAYEEGKREKEQEIQDIFIDCFCYDFDEEKMLEGWEKYHTKINEKKAIQHHCNECSNGYNVLDFYNNIKCKSIK